MIETTSICNAKCGFCPNATLKRPHMVMRDEIFEKIIQRIQEENIDVERFILHLNGEPFTDPHLIERICKLKLVFPKVPVWFTSNFSLPSHKKIDELLRSGLETITISMNASDAETYKKIMGLNYQKTFDNLEYLLRKNKEENSPLHIRVSIVNTGEPKTVDEFQKKFSSMADVRVLHLGQWVQEEKPNNFVDNQRNSGICADLLQQICILSNGDYAYCCFDAEGHIGLNVRDVPLLKAFYSEKYESLRKVHEKEGRIHSMCKNCSFSY